MPRITPVTGAFTASGSSIACGAEGDFNVSLSGTFAATVVPERSFDGGNTWLPVTYIDGSAISWTAPMSAVLYEPEKGTLTRLTCTWTSGTVTYRISQ